MHVLRFVLGRRSAACSEGTCTMVTVEGPLLGICEVWDLKLHVRVEERSCLQFHCGWPSPH
jgi:hypothetical protein